MSDPAFFLAQRAEASKGVLPPLPADPDERGQPGFTLVERRRFNEILVAGGLADAFRHLHPTKKAWTYMGHPGSNVPGKYRGRGMRIDHFVVSRALLPRVISVEIPSSELSLQQQTQRVGFLGSDHAPILLRLAQGPPPAAGAGGSAREGVGAGEAASAAEIREGGGGGGLA